MSTQSYEPDNYFLDFWAPRDPVPDGRYIARLGPSPKVSFLEKVSFSRGVGVRINFEAEILEPIGDPLPPGPWQRAAYGHLYSCLRHGWHGVGKQAYWAPIEQESTLTGFLKNFGLYEKGMSTSKRVRLAKQFIESRPVVGVSTIWVAYSQRYQRRYKRFMSNFPLRPDHTHDPNILTEEGEQLRAVAHVAWYWPLPPDLESKWKERLNGEGQIQTGDACFQGGKYV